MKTIQSIDRPRGGFSLFEMLAAVAVVAVLATLSARLVGDTPEAAEQQKLISDVRSINAAIDVYRVFGGSLASAADAEAVIQKLQSHANDATAEETAGITGHVIDPRLVVAMQTPADAATGKPRAVWNAARQHFEIVTSGAAGVKRFEMDTAIASVAAVDEVRDPSMKLARTSTWIWDYDDTASGTPIAPTAVPYGPGTGSGPTTPPPGPPAPGVLNPPVFSVAGGTYPITDFNLNLKLTNPNAGILSRVMISVDSGPWVPYSGSIVSVDPGASVSAFAESLHADWSNSSIAANTYLAGNAQLITPTITMSAPKFDYDANANIAVTITDRNNHDISTLEFRLNGGAWESYTGVFNLYVLDYRFTGTLIETRAISLSPYYTDSAESSANVDQPDDLFTISGTAGGAFTSPTGPTTMVTNLSSGSSSTLFTWGTPDDSGDAESTLEYTGELFTGVSAGTRFLVGTIDYYNGTIASDSGAEGVQLAVEILFDGSETRTFTFDLELINVPNGSGTAEGDADFVKLGAITSIATATISGREYRLILEFGETTETGFSSIDEFHVIEDETAMGNVYGTLELADLIDEVAAAMLEADAADGDPYGELSTDPNAAL